MYIYLLRKKGWFLAFGSGGGRALPRILVHNLRAEGGLKYRSGVLESICGGSE